MKQTHILSKSRFMNGLQCLKSLYLLVHNPELKDPSNSYSEYILNTGTKIGELAREHFDNGLLIKQDYTEHDAAIEATLKTIEDKSIDHIYEAAFLFEDIKIRVDILKNNHNGTFDIIEVKSSTKVKESHLYDLSIQKYVLDNLGFKISQSKLMYINSDYVYDGKSYILNELFKIEDLSLEIAKLASNIKPTLQLMRESLEKVSVPEIQIGAHCKKPNQCPFYGHCRKGFPKDHISKLYRIGDKKLNQLRDQGITSIKEIPDEFKLTETQHRIKESVVREEPFFSPEVKVQLSNLEYPLFFMDFETSNPALPIFAESSSWKHIPFQWSVHKLHNDGTLEHFDFLPHHSNDPRKEFAESLVKIIGDRGNVIVYYDAFEKGIIEKLSQHLSDNLGDRLLSINGRVFDLYRLIYNHVYHPDFEGSFSIKKVLPALIPNLSYKGMSIADGATALIAYQKMIDVKVPEDERKKIHRDLTEYCKLDTLAMVEIFKFLREDNDLDAEVEF